MDRDQMEGSSLDAVAAVSWGENRIDLFWVAADRTLWHQAMTGAGWQAPESLGGTLASGQAVTAWAADQMEVFAIFDDGELWDRYWDGISWHAWESLGGVPHRAADRLIVGTGPTGRLCAGPGRAHMASVVGRLTLGRMGTALNDPGRPEPRRTGRRAGSGQVAMPHHWAARSA